MCLCVFAFEGQRTAQRFLCMGRAPGGCPVKEDRVNHRWEFRAPAKAIRELSSAGFFWSRFRSYCTAFTLYTLWHADIFTKVSMTYISALAPAFYCTILLAVAIPSSRRGSWARPPSTFLSPLCCITSSSSAIFYCPLIVLVLPIRALHVPWVDVVISSPRHLAYFRLLHEFGPCIQAYWEKLPDAPFTCGHPC